MCAYASAVYAYIPRLVESYKHDCVRRTALISISKEENKFNNFNKKNTTKCVCAYWHLLVWCMRLLWASSISFPFISSVFLHRIEHDSDDHFHLLFITSCVWIWFGSYFPISTSSSECHWLLTTFNSERCIWWRKRKQPTANRINLKCQCNDIAASKIYAIAWKNNDVRDQNYLYLLFWHTGSAIAPWLSAM